MAALEQLWSEIEAARAEFRDALERARGGWDEHPDGDEWTRRAIVEHAIAADYAFARWPLILAGETPHERQELALADAGEALRAFSASTALADAAWRKIEAGDLQREVRPDRTVEWGLELVARHLREHAEQFGAD